MGRKRLNEKTEMAAVLVKSGWTIEQASKRLGVSAALIRHVAAGRRNLSQNLREKIRQVFALGGKASDVAAAGYDSPSDRDDVAAVLADHVRALVQAAADAPDKGAAVVADISAALDKVLARHKLGAKAAEFLESESTVKEAEMTRREIEAQLRRIGAPAIPEWEKVRLRVPPDEVLQLRRVESRKWLAPRFYDAERLVTSARWFKVTVTVSRAGKRLCSWPEERLAVSGVVRQ